MADHVFSTARLRGYRVLEDAGLGDAVSLQILNAVIAGRLWLPYSLIEIAFRNACDRVITDAHPAGVDWLVENGREGDVLVVKDVTGPPTLRGVRPDGTPDDPIAEAARMAGRNVNRDRISRDDLIAHLMMGFWVNRCPGALLEDPGLQVWELAASAFDSPLDNADQLQSAMGTLARSRNRVAHHEPLLFRAKHVFTKKGEAKTGADLIASLQAAVPAFLEEIQLAVDTATTMAPMASHHLESVPNRIRSEIAALEAALRDARQLLRENREARIAARQAERDAKLSSEANAD